MKSTFFLLVFFSLIVSIHSQESFSRVKIDLEDKSLKDLAILGIETDHGILKKGKYLINDFSAKEIELLASHQWNYELLIEDVSNYYATRNQDSNLDVDQRSVSCFTSLYNYQTPANYRYGSMGGYLTYSEMLDELDRMQATYPQLITSRTPIGDYHTEEGRSIFYIKVGNYEFKTDKDKPEVLYTALHHAREPNSLSQMIFYLWYLLENYEQDNLVRYIVDHTDLFFIPCVNPDGYIYNESTNPNGGGLWRKNRAIINGDIAGVDLNRNYGYEWAHDNFGSSENPNSNTYRGEEAFSEPETQAVSSFCLEHNFKIALNYHTFGNLLIYPWGYSDTLTQDSDVYNNIASALTSENEYRAGTGTETVGYIVNGGSDDWMYGEAGIFSLTPEVGSADHGFWPPQNKIDELNKSALKQNLVAALLQHEYVETTVDQGDEEVVIDATKYSFGNETIDLQLESLEAALTFTQTEFPLSIAPFESQQIKVNFSIEEVDDLPATEYKYVLHKIYQNFTISDTLAIEREIEYEIAMLDAISNMDRWISDTWNLSSEQFVSSSKSMTDSPNGNYPSATESHVTSAEAIDLSNAKNAALQFSVWWDIEKDFDYAQVMISTDGVNFHPLCGEYSREGNEFQDLGEPVYEGRIRQWRREHIDISEYAGQEVYIRFRMVSDDFQEFDGIYIDDVKFLVLEQSSSSTKQENELQNNHFKIYPNPVSDEMFLDFESSQNGDLLIYNFLGQLVERLQIKDIHIRINTSSFPAGMYTCKWISNSNHSQTISFFKQ